MNGWFARLISDKNGNPNEHIVAALWGSLVLFVLAVYLVYTGHALTLLDFGGAHAAVWTAAGAGSKLTGDT
jgi:hypothetical protein